MARATTVGTMISGAISYGNTFLNDEFPMNQPLDKGLMYTYSAGRWSTRRYKETHLFTRENATTPPAWASNTWGTRDIIVKGNLESAQFNIPIQLTSNNGNYKFTTSIKRTGNWSDTEWLSIASCRGADNSFGMNITNKGIVNDSFRPVTDWNFNKVAMYPKIYGVYGCVVDKSAADYPYGIEYIVPHLDHPVDLYDFYYNNTRPAHNNNFLGYTYAYDILIQGSGENTSWWQFLFADEFYFSLNKYKYYNWSSIKELTVDGYYAFASAGRTLLGIEPQPSTYIDGAYQCNWIGPTSIEGIPVQSTATALLYWSGNEKMAGDIPVIPASVLESELLNYIDLVKIALQNGIPVITEGATKTRFLNGTDLAECSDDYVFYPKIADARVSTEEYIQGEQNIKDTKQYKDAKDGKGVMTETPEFERDDADTNQYTEDIPLNEPPFTTIDKFSRYYALSSTDLEDFCDFIYTNDTSVIARIIDGLKLNGENPMNFMLGLRMLPFNLMQYITTEAEEIGFGNGVYTGVMAERITKDSFIIDLGTCKFNKYHHNFLDYEPYTTAKLYIPYCGEISVPTSVFVGHEIKVKLIVDVTTGSCIGVVYKDGIPSMYANGMIGVEIPIIGTNATEYVNSAINLIGKFASGAAQAGTNLAMIGTTTFSAGGGSSMSIGSGVATSSINVSSGSTNVKKFNAPGALGGVGQMLEAAYEFNNMPTPLEVTGTGMAFSGFYKPQYCYFVIQQSIPMNVQGYAENIGYACLESGTILNYLDCLIVANNPKVQPSTATFEETKELNELLSTGVWV